MDISEVSIESLEIISRIIEHTDLQIKEIIDPSLEVVVISKVSHSMTVNDYKNHVISIVGEVWNNDPKTYKRSGNLPRIRWQIATILRKDTLMTLEAITNAVGLKNHTTIIHGLERHEDLIETDENYRAMYMECLDRIGRLEYNKRVRGFSMEDLQNEIKARRFKKTR